MTKSKIINIILIWGAVWGIFEAVIGYLIHMLPINIGYLIWFPAAFFFMERCYKATGKAYSAIYIALFAASIKMLNLLMPVRIDKVINPAISIVLEGFSLAVIFIIFKNMINKYAEQAFLSAIVWRGFFLIYLLFVPKWMYEISVLSSSAKLIQFLVVETFFNSLTIYIYLLLRNYYDKKKLVKDKIHINPKLVYCTTLILIAGDILLNIIL